MSTAPNEMLTELMRRMGQAARAASAALSLASTQTKNQALQRGGGGHPRP